MRIRLDSGDTAFLREPEIGDLQADLDDFLNFFEFIAFLHRRREIRLEEVRTLFAYPLQTVAKNANVISYVREYDYGETDRLLKELGYVRRD